MHRQHSRPAHRLPSSTRYWSTALWNSATLAIATNVSCYASKGHCTGLLGYVWPPKTDYICVQVALVQVSTRTHTKL